MSLSDWAALAQAPQKAAPPVAPSLSSVPLPAGAGDWWNLPAKVDAAREVFESGKRMIPGWNDAGDAMRHAEASRRLSEAAGPIFTSVVGVGHELVDSIPTYLGGHGQPRPERDMDLHNNAEGIQAAKEGRPVDPANLQLAPIYPDGRPPDPYGGPYRDR
jgi:hypothetical protein